MAANTTENLLLRVDVEFNQTRLSELEKQLKQSKDALTNLNKSFAAGKISAEELAVGQTKLKQETANVTQEQRILTRANEAQIAIDKAAAGSVDQLAAKTKLLTQQYNALGTEQKKTAAGRALQAELKATNEALKEAGASVGDFRRNVGGYKESVKEAIKESGLFGGVIERVSGAQEKYNAVQTVTKAVLGGTSGALGALKVAFLAVPIFAVIAALGVLYTFLTKTQDGLDFVEKKTAAASAVFNVLLKTILPVGEAMLRLFTEPKKAVADLVDFLKTTVANQFKAFGVLLDAVRNRDFGKLQDGLIQLGTGITDGTAKAKGLASELVSAAAAGERITAETQRIRAAERQLNVERDSSRAKIEGLKKLSDDSTKSVAVRTAAAKEAAEIENRLLASQLKLQADKVANLQAEQKLKGNITNADKDALADLRREQSNTAQESLTLQTELQNKINSLGTEGTAQQIARRRDLLTLNEQLIDQELAAAKEGSDKQLKLLEQRLENSYRLELTTANLTASQRKTIEAKYQNDSFKLAQDFAAKRQELAKTQLEAITNEATAALTAERKRKDDAQKEEDDSFKQSEAMLNRYLVRRRNELDKSYEDGLLDKKQYDSKLEQLEDTSFGARVVLAKQFGKDTEKLEQDQARARGKVAVRLREDERKVYEARLNAAEAFGAEVGSLFAQSLTDTGQSLQEFAGKVLVLILDSLEKTILASQAEAAAKSIALNPTPAGFIQAAITTAAITVAFEGAKAAILAGSAKPFNTGGVVPGDTSRNADSQLTYLTPGEIVLSQGVGQKYPELLPVMSHLNAIAGGANFAPGFAPSRTQVADGGLTARTIGAGAGIDYDKLAAACARTPVDVNYVATGQKYAHREATKNRFNLR